MTAKAEFDAEEWSAVVEGRALAGMIDLSADRGGSIRETLALAKAYSEAGDGHTALVDAIVAEGPRGVSFDSPEQLREEGMRQLRVAGAALYGTATAKELDDYRAFVLDVAHRVAAAHREAGETISTNEQAALDGIAEALAAGS